MRKQTVEAKRGETARQQTVKLSGIRNAPATSSPAYRAEMEMGEAKRRHRDDEPTVIKGPFSYEICLFGLDQIMAGGLIELLSDGPPSPRGVTIIKATASRVRISNARHERRRS